METSSVHMRRKIEVSFLTHQIYNEGKVLLIAQKTASCMMI